MLKTHGKASHIHLFYNTNERNLLPDALKIIYGSLMPTSNTLHPKRRTLMEHMTLMEHTRSWKMMPIYVSLIGVKKSISRGFT